MTPSRLRWGIFWILVGLVILANNLGWLSWWVWADLLHLWPLLLIAIGLELIVKKSKLQWLGYLSTLLIVGAFIWVVSQDRGWQMTRHDVDLPWHDSNVEVATSFDGQQRATVDLTFNDGRLYLEEGDSDLLRVKSQHSAYEPDLVSDDDPISPRIRVLPRKEHHNMRNFIRFSISEDIWRAYLHPDLPSRVNLDLEDSKLRFDSRNLLVDTLNLDVDDCDLILRCGDGIDMNYISIDGRETDVIAYLPDSVGIKLEGFDPGNSSTERFDLVEAGDFFVNDLYGQATHNYYIKCDMRGGNLRLRHY